MPKFPLFSLMFFLIFSFIISLPSLAAEERSLSSHFVIRGGYLDGGAHSGGLLQMDYQWKDYFWHQIRPQAILIVSEWGSTYIGLGIGWELYLTDQLLLIPSFSPGLYFKGRGRNLGCPLEFRSAIELTYEWKNKVRLGIQLSHLSNAHLSHRNPGFNTLTLGLAFPLGV